MSIKRSFFAGILLNVLSSSLCAQSLSTPLWKIYYDSAQNYYSGDYQKGISLLTRAEKSALNDLGIYDNNYLVIVNDLGLLYWHVDDYPTAEKLLLKNINTRRELGNTSDSYYIDAVTNLATVYSQQGKFQKASACYKEIISNSPGIDNQNRWRAAERLLELYEINNYLDSALLLCGNFNKETVEIRNGSWGLSFTLARGRLNRKLRKYEESRNILEPLEQSLRSEKETHLKTLYVGALQELSLLSLETGKLDDAEKKLLQCFRLVRSGERVETQREIEVLNNLASTYERLNISDKASVYYQQALDLCQTLYGPSDISTLTIKSNIAGIHLRQGDLSSAIKSYEEISKILVGLPGDKVLYITVLNNLATAYRKSNQFSEASDRLTVALMMISANKLDNEDLSAVVLNNQAILLTAMGEPEKAIEYYEKAYSIKQKLFGENSVSLMDLAGNMAVVYWALKKPELAIPLFRKSIAMAVRQVRYIFPNLSEGEQIQFYQRLKEDFERFNAVAFQSAKEHPDLLNDVFNNQVVIKSILFFTQQHRQVLINQKHDSLLYKQYELMRSKREQLGRFYHLPLKDLATAETTSSTLEKEIDQLEKMISLKTSETVSEKMMERVIRWEDIQKTVAADQALIELIRVRKYDLRAFVENNEDRVRFGFTDSVYYGALVTTSSTVSSPQLTLFKDGNNMETRFLNYYRNALTYGVEDQNSYSCYWKPIEQYLANKKKIYLSGDGVYHRLNLNTIRHADTGEYLLQRYDFHYLLNPGQFIQEKGTATSSKKAVLFGDPVFETSTTAQSTDEIDDFELFQPLPGTQKEVVRINDILKTNGWKTDVFLNKMASEKNIKSVHSPDMLHIATHGFFSADQVKLTADAKKNFLFYSGLVFTGTYNGSEEKNQLDDDGILTAFEVMNLDLSSTRLVVLSACETGLGKIENGEGVFGLQRSFLQAGARNIMISLWKVDDLMTQELMGQFYLYLFKGNAVRTALKLAQLDQLKKQRDPSDWGAFVVVGVD